MKTTARRASSIGLLTLMSTALLSACALAGSGSGSGSEDGEDNIQIAYLSASSSNTWLTASRNAMEAEAEKVGATITEFDAKFEPGVAADQIQDVITAGTYQGIIIATNDGTAVVPAIEDALEAGIEVVILNQVIGDQLDTADPQISGVAASVIAPPKGTGERLGKLAVQACEGQDECSVVYMYGIKGTPYDTAVREGFDEVVSASPGITVVAEAEGGYLGADEPRKAIQDVLQAYPDFDVLVGTGDQQISGALLALEDAGKTDVKTIGVGASEPALEAIKDGTWFGDVAGVPDDEGKAAFDALMSAITDGTDSGGIDVVSSLPDGGLITAENVDLFTAQWAG